MLSQPISGEDRQRLARLLHSGYLKDSVPVPGFASIYCELNSGFRAVTSRGNAWSAAQLMYLSRSDPRRMSLLAKPDASSCERGLYAVSGEGTLSERLSA